MSQGCTCHVCCKLAAGGAEHNGPGRRLQGCSEYEAYQAVTQWAAGSAALEDVEQLLPLVRFPLMCAHEMRVRLACHRRVGSQPSYAMCDLH